MSKALAKDRLRYVIESNGIGDYAFANYEDLLVLQSPQLK